jgi:hypothetical protein
VSYRSVFSALLVAVTPVCHHEAPAILKAEYLKPISIRASSPPLTLHFSPPTRAGATLSWQISVEVVEASALAVEVVVHAPGAPPTRVDAVSIPTLQNMGYGLSSPIRVYPTRPQDRLSMVVRCTPRVVTCTLSDLTATIVTAPAA